MRKQCPLLSRVFTRVRLPTSLAPRLKDLNRIPGRVVEQDLRAARSGHDVVAEMDPDGAKSIDFGRVVFDDEVDTVPAAGSGPAARVKPSSRQSSSSSSTSRPPRRSA